MNDLVTQEGALSVLLVESNPADAVRLEELLDQVEGPRHRIHHVTSLAAALKVMASDQSDVVVLALRLPNAGVLEALRSMRDARSHLPIVVLASDDDDELALACLGAGADEHLSREVLHPAALQRVIRHAVARARGAGVRELSEILACCRELSSAGGATAVTASMAGIGSISERYPEAFNELIRDYGRLFITYLDHGLLRKPRPRAAMERIVARIGDAGGGPRDLMDLHVEAMGRGEVGARARARNAAARAGLFALEMMALLVDRYRVGHRRLFSED